jgi:hypothetical protein
LRSIRELPSCLRQRPFVHGFTANPALLPNYAGLYEARLEIKMAYLIFEPMNKLKNYVWVIIIVAILGTFIINEENYEPNQHVKAEFTCSYMFVVDGKTYTNNFHDLNAKIGDTVEVEYAKDLPSFNKPIHTTD